MSSKGLGHQTSQHEEVHECYVDPLEHFNLFLAIDFINYFDLLVHDINKEVQANNVPNLANT